MGDWASKIIRVVSQFPPGKVPGVNPGYIALVYSDGRDEVRLWFLIDFGRRAVESNQNADALFDALSAGSLTP
jgi:hypothetical protein